MVRLQTWYEFVYICHSLFLYSSIHQTVHKCIRGIRVVIDEGKTGFPGDDQQILLSVNATLQTGEIPLGEFLLFSYEEWSGLRGILLYFFILTLPCDSNRQYHRRRSWFFAQSSSRSSLLFKLCTTSRTCVNSLSKVKLQRKWSL